DGIRDRNVTGVQTCALPISSGFDPGPAFHGAVDVVVGNRGALCFLDGVEESRVAGRVASADAGGYFDVLHHFGEEFAPLRIVGSLLVLGRRPFRVSSHAQLSFLRAWSARQVVAR